MAEMVGALIVITTVPDENLAVKITESLLQQQLAACVHVLPSGRSHYRWKGELESAVEITLIIKTRADRYAELESAITHLHPYEVPEIVALSAVAGLPAYLKWIVDETN